MHLHPSSLINLNILQISKVSTLSQLTKIISPFIHLEDEVVSEAEDTIVVPGTKTDKDIATPAGNITRYYDNWSKVTSNNFILCIVSECYQIQFFSKPFELNSVISNPSSSDKILALKQQIMRYLQTGCGVRKACGH